MILSSQIQNNLWFFLILSSAVSNCKFEKWFKRITSSSVFAVASGIMWSICTFSTPSHSRPYLFLKVDNKYFINHSIEMPMISSLWKFFGYFFLFNEPYMRYRIFDFNL